MTPSETSDLRCFLRGGRALKSSKADEARRPRTDERGRSPRRSGATRRPRRPPQTRPTQLKRPTQVEVFKDRRSSPTSTLSPPIWVVFAQHDGRAPSKTTQCEQSYQLVLESVRLHSGGGLLSPPRYDYISRTGAEEATCAFKAACMRVADGLCIHDLELEGDSVDGRCLVTKAGATNPWRATLVTKQSQSAI